MAMNSPSPPTIFSHRRRAAVRARAEVQQGRPDAARYIAEDMVEDVLDRLDFLRHRPACALLAGSGIESLAARLRADGCEVLEATTDFNEEQPYPFGGFELIASLGRLDTVNDLPGALIHLRHALAPGGLMIASFPGAGCLPVLRAAMLAADGERPAARTHPAVDVRAGGQLLQRAGFDRPVVDSRGLDVRFPSLARLVSDLREQGLTSTLASVAPVLTRSAYRRAAEAFAACADADGRVTEHFEILTLSGWRT